MNILLVEDAPDIARPILAALEHERYRTTWAKDYPTALACIGEAEPDLVVLDVMLQNDANAGFRLAEHLRQSGFHNPLLFLTARDTLEDRVHGLDLGGDDYLTKPFELPELLARIRALIRRNAQLRSGTLERGALRLEFNTRCVFWDNQEIILTEREFSLLELMALNPERIYKVDELLERLFPNADSGHHILRTYVSRLRDKLASEAIRTVPGGYRLGV